MTKQPCTVEPVKREIINDQLLAALDDKSKVAIVASESDLNLLITALETAIDNTISTVLRENATVMCNDLRQLRKVSFGQ